MTCLHVKDNKMFTSLVVVMDTVLSTNYNYIHN